MPLRRLSSRKRLALRALFSRGAILLESLVALTLLSLSAAGTLAAFDRLDGTYRAVHRLSAQERAIAKQAESMSEH
ncbi:MULTISPECIES: hypothetical protein [Ralstonia solanacearum species complex]|uniref:Probable transmembrane protein n=1 Tax=Ralstonia solanacearum (strain UW551) TaxID=342110 RepID=A0AB33VHE0_RALSU|nr:hypothetical protein [Ralstonia solanacearum]ATI26852.1 hypothetical protein CCY86_04705 [Ralstonia solanacearum]EAP74274.1 Probable transmembrane protein [Ralstonia solanacearum UW551]KFX29609.1 membrane protein [Ralstonia solanacearum]KFZ93468.1 membrane protein [Ralstonia solanacearum]MDN4064087.1 hypothetical protein [Ralstonia solanacearum]